MTACLYNRRGRRTAVLALHDRRAHVTVGRRQRKRLRAAVAVAASKRRTRTLIRRTPDVVCLIGLNSVAGRRLTRSRALAAELFLRCAGRIERQVFAGSNSAARRQATPA